MAHPFSKMFDKALKKSDPKENQVLEVAEKLRAKGYSPREIFDVLTKLQKSLIDKGEMTIVSEAIEEFVQHLDLGVDD